MQKPKLCLNMITLNEAHIIKETLECVSKYIDYYVINDTGSTDGTQNIIKEYFDSKGISGEIVNHEFRKCDCHSGEYKKYSFFHFGWNRTYALEACLGKSEYIWVIDADDLVVGNLVIPDLKDDSYTLLYGKGFTYQRTQIFKNDPALKWRYVGALHEYPTCDKPNRTNTIITGDYYIDSRRLGARSNDPKKYLKDAHIFEELLKVNPKNERDTFYCAQSYFDYKDYQNAIKWYKKRIELGGWYEEVFYSYYRVAWALENMGAPWVEVENAFLDAYKYCKLRAESLHRIASHYIHTKDYQNAYKFLKMAEKIPYPEKCVLFIFKDVYDYKILSDLALSAYHLGKYHESYSLTKNLLDSGKVYTEDIKNVKNTMDLAKKKLDEMNKKTVCVYTGNENINQNSSVLKIIDYMDQFYKVFIVGNNIDIYNIKNLSATIYNIKSMNQIFEFDYLILYNSLNYFYDNIKLNGLQTILLQNDNMLKLVMTNGLKIQISNGDYLNEFLNKIDLIVCCGEKIKNKIANDYKIQIDQLSYLEQDNKSSYYKIFEDHKCNYTSNLAINNNTNGLIFVETPGMELLKESKTIYHFADQLLINYYKEISKELSDMPELYHKIAQMESSISNYDQAISNLNLATKLLKNNKNHLLHYHYRDIILLEKADILHKTGKYMESYEMANEIIKRGQIPQKLFDYAEGIRDKNIDFVKDSYLFCSKHKIQNIVKGLEGRKEKKITFSITTCKRLDLFEKTICSFINCCTDLHLIDYWLCVDDNSSAEDRATMKSKYPFFDFYLKTEDQKGHSKSMNIIRDIVIKHNTMYNLHMEDDFHFIQKRDYITESINIFKEDKGIGQVLFNRNYHEIEPFKKPIKGGFIKKGKGGLRYVLHEYVNSETPEYQQFLNKYKGHSTTGYWPHFSFRPSIMKISMLKDVGCFYNTGHFEMQYAKEYVDWGYKSAFLDTFSCIHIGKKTWETGVKNSYHLNETSQFTTKNKEITINIVSTSNIEQWKQFKEEVNSVFPSYTRIIPKNITHIDDYSKKVFHSNNFNYARSIMKEIMVHINFFKETTTPYLLVLKDGIKFDIPISQFWEKIQTYAKYDYEFIIFDQYDDQKNNSLSKYTGKIEFDNISGYLVSRPCINKILAYVNSVGIKDKNYINDIIINAHISNKKMYHITETSLSAPDLTFTKLEGYKFYSQLDSFGNDIGYYGGKTIEELKNICEDQKGAGFNTLGWIKHKVTTENEFIYLPTSTKFSEGFYMKV